MRQTILSHGQTEPIRSFDRFTDVEHLGASLQQGLVPTGTYGVSEKMDGANAGVILTPNGLLLHSRRAYLATIDEHGDIIDHQHDLNGFVTYIQREAGAFFAALDLGDHVFGEWLTPHTVTYPPDMYRQWYVYPHQRCERAGLLPFPHATPIPRLLLVGDDAAVAERAQAILDEYKAAANRPIEGVVFHHLQTHDDFKLVLPEFKETMGKAWGKTRKQLAATGGMEDQLASFYTARQYVKMREKAADLAAPQPLTRKQTSMMLGLCWQDFLKESMGKGLKKLGYPVINTMHVKKALEQRVRDMYFMELDTGMLPQWAHQVGLPELEAAA